MHKKWEWIIRGLLIFGGCYLIFDGLLHLLGIKLSSVKDWSEPAIAYASLINMLYGSFAFLAALFSFIIQKDLKKYKSLAVASSIWATFHGVLLLFLIWTNNYQIIFQNSPSLLVWLPIYREYLTINAVLLFTYSISVYFWQKS